MKNRRKKKNLDPFAELQKMNKKRMEVVMSLIPNAVWKTYGCYLEMEVIRGRIQASK